MEEQQRGMRPTALLGVLLLAGCLAAGVSAEEGPEPEADESEQPLRKIKMYAENWRFMPSEIRVPAGTRVVIDFVSRDASHSFVLKDYEIKVPLPQDKGGHVEFVADRKGEFRWKCGRPCGDGCPKMSGKLIVE